MINFYRVDFIDYENIFEDGVFFMFVKFVYGEEDVFIFKVFVFVIIDYFGEENVMILLGVSYWIMGEKVEFVSEELIVFFLSEIL